ncbi:MAG TPA: CoA ester lyase [Sphingomonas sp.]|nr:CoA ester lyase [Sphingomonas sp.]
MTVSAAARIRSALFMPASNERAIARARDLDCDAVILDLEDAVAPALKDHARGAAIAAVAAGFGHRYCAIRVNPIDTEWGEADLVAVRASSGDAVVLPKVDGPDDLLAARALLGDGGMPIWAMIESCAAIVALPSIVSVAQATQTELLIAGTNDLAKDMRCRAGPDRLPLLSSLSAIVVAARAVGIIALDGVCNAIDDPARFAAECEQGAMLGFDGKTLIHPSQIAAANRAFGPDPDAVAWAHRVVAAFADPANDSKGAIRLDDAMVERLHLAEAERILAAAR